MNAQAHDVKVQRTLGWIAVALSMAITSFWAFWGIIENFHEGWYHESLASNIGLMLAQYLSPMLGFMIMTLVALSWARVGAALHVIAAVWTFWFFGGVANAGGLVIALPLLGLGALYWFGRPRPKNLAIGLALAFPAVTLVLSGAEPAWRVLHRFDDGDLRARLVEGNAIKLIWAPAGPGWPREGTRWNAAQRACRYLNAAGTDLASQPQDIWHLPTVDEVVRSLTRGGANSVGVWDLQTGRATYAITPDKESPLWAVHSQVIYWWTGTEIDEDRAYVVAYDGQVWPRRKDSGPAYLGYRCVRPPEEGG